MALAIQLVSESMWASGGVVHDAICAVGRGLIIVCVLGRTWRTLYIGGRKRVDLVQDGPYSISRNPLHVFSIIGAGGVGAAAESLVTIPRAAFACYAVLAGTVRKEGSFLAARFGPAYEAYRRRVPLSWPRFPIWRDAPSVETAPRLVPRTFDDGLFLFLSILLVEPITCLRRAGYLPVLFVFP